MVNKFLKNSGNFFSSKQKNILSAALVLMVLILTSSVLGLIRNRLLANAFFSGSEKLLDIYFAAFRVPDMIYQLLIMGALSAAFIPIYSDFIEDNKKTADSFASAVINLTFLLFIVMSVFVFAAAKPLSYLIAPGFGHWEIGLMSQLTRLLLIAQAFFVLSGFMTGILQTNGRFLLPALSAVLYNLGIIFGIVFLSERFSIFGVVYGVLIGALLHFIIQVPLVIKLGFDYKLIFSLQINGVKKFFSLVWPRILSLGATQINLSVITFIATSLAVGSLSIFTFSQNIISMPVNLFGLTIGQASLPFLSREVVKNKERFKYLFEQSFYQILYLSLPSSIVLIVLRIPIVRLVLGSRNFPWEATITTGQIVAILSVSIAAQSLIQLLIRFFYAVKNTKTPLVINTLSVLLNIFLAFFLVYFFHLGVLGLSIAVSLSLILHGLLLIYSIRKTTGWIDKKFIYYVSKIFFVNAVLSAVLWFLMRIMDRLLDTTRTFNLIILTIVTLVVSLALYVLLSIVFNIKEVKSIYIIAEKLKKWRLFFSPPEELIETGTSYE